MLSDLGRRVERLMYFGTLLLVVCAFQVYMVATVDYIRTDNPAAFSVLADQIEGDQSRLQDLFAIASNPPKLKKEDVSSEIAAMRRALGLPPKMQPIEPTPTETYSAALDRLVRLVALKTGMRSNVLSDALDTKKPPLELIKNLRERQKELEKRLIVVWGIEAPVTLPFQYGSAQYQVPNWVFANLLFVALVPLVIGWLGSMHFTRQRELFIIRSLSDYKMAFPHVMNILPVVPMSIRSIFDERLVGMKSKNRNRRFNRVFYSLLRSIVILIFSLPMVATLGYSAAVLLFSGDSIDALEVIFASIVSAILCFQVIAVFLQEWWLLWGKDFTA